MSRTKRKNWTETYAREVLGEIQQHGKTLSEMARELGVTPQRISWWKKRLQGEMQLESVNKPRFVEVAMHAAQIEERAFTIRTSHGQAVEVWPGFDAAELHRLLTVVEDATC